jgi:GNAT superfamily N-acetyltransferase
VSFTVRAVRPHEWERFRELRLRMLADTPIAFGETLAQAGALDDDAWRERTARVTEPPSAALVAVTDDGTWVGIMRGFVSTTRGPMLVSVFVDPAWRGAGAGVADALLDGVIAWARGVGQTLQLDVHADNPRAIAFYRRRGFVATGRIHPYDLPPYGDEMEMELRVAD